MQYSPLFAPLTAPGHFTPGALHIPDGLLSPSVAIVCWLVSASILLFAIRRTRGEIGDRTIPLMGIMAAFIFAAQMLNFPVAFGTSGHLLGGTLAAITLGPWAGMLVMVSVIMVQALLFQDGGLLALGANTLNMGLLTVVIGYGLFRLGRGRSRNVQLAAAGTGAWLSVLAGALATSIELWLSGSARLDLVAPPMLAVHVLIGIGEALITTTALAFIWRMRPDLADTTAPKGGPGWAVAGVVATLGIVALSPLAALDPDGLERVAADLGFISLSQEAPFQVMPDYTISFLSSTPLSTILAGLVGVLAVAGVVALAAYLIKRSRPA